MIWGFVSDAAGFASAAAAFGPAAGAAAVPAAASSINPYFKISAKPARISRAGKLSSTPVSASTKRG